MSGNTYRQNTKVVQIGNVSIGGGNPIAIQSMTNTRTDDVEATVAQILRLEEAGCEIIRCTVPDEKCAKAIARIKERIHIPLVADIHFDYKMAIAAMENGADKVVVNTKNLDKFRLAGAGPCGEIRRRYAGGPGGERSRQGGHGREVRL